MPLQWRRRADASSFISNVLMDLSPVIRRFLLIIIDALLLPLALWLSFWLRLAHPFHPSFIAAGSWLLITVLLVGLPLYAFTGQYKGLTRYVGSQACYRLAFRNGLLLISLAVIGVIFQLPMPPRSSWILLWLLLTGFTGTVRFALRDVFSLRSTQHKQQVRVVIYGAGEAGASWRRLCVLRATTGLSPSSTTTRPIGVVRSTGLRFNRPEIDRIGGLH